jgi:hypothetical protein
MSCRRAASAGGVRVLGRAPVSCIRWFGRPNLGRVRQRAGELIRGRFRGGSPRPPGSAELLVMAPRHSAQGHGSVSAAPPGGLTFPETAATLGYRRRRFRYQASPTPPIQPERSSSAAGGLWGRYTPSHRRGPPVRCNGLVRQFPNSVKTPDPLIFFQCPQQPLGRRVHSLTAKLSGNQDNERPRVRWPPRKPGNSSLKQLLPTLDVQTIAPAAERFPHASGVVAQFASSPRRRSTRLHR